MKKLLPLLMTLGVSCGCVGLPLLPDTKDAAQVGAVAERATAPVAPDQINDQNARDKASALKVELDRAEETEHEKPKK